MRTETTLSLSTDWTLSPTSDLMYDNVVRQLLAALAQSNHDATPTMRDSGIQTVDPSMDPSVIGVGELGGEPLVIKRPRKKMKWMPTSNPLPQSFKVRRSHSYFVDE